jgi:hypothetical protein
VAQSRILTEAEEENRAKINLKGGSRQSQFSTAKSCEHLSLEFVGGQG